MAKICNEKKNAVKKNFNDVGIVFRLRKQWSAAPMSQWLVERVTMVMWQRLRSSILLVVRLTRNGRGRKRKACTLNSTNNPWTTCTTINIVEKTTITFQRYSVVRHCNGWGDPSAMNHPLARKCYEPIVVRVSTPPKLLCRKPWEYPQESSRTPAVLQYAKPPNKK